MDRYRVDFTIGTKEPVMKQRLETLKEYVDIVAKRVGMEIKKTEVKDG